MLSPALQQRLLNAVEKTAELVAAGQSPNDAIVQAVKEGQLSDDCVAPIVHAYNTGRTTQQREYGADVWEKAASFELADTRVILQRMFPQPGAIKQAAATCGQSEPHTSYNVSPKYTIKRHQSKTIAMRGVEKQASAVKPAPPQPHLFDQLQRLQKQELHCRQMESEAFDKFAAALDRLADHLQHPSAKPLALTEKHAALLHGDAGTAVLRYVKDLRPGLCKQASRSAFPGESVDATAQQLIRDVLDLAVKQGEATQAYDAAKAAVRKTAATLCLPAAQQRSSSLLPLTLEDLEKRAAPSAPGILSSMLGTMAAKNIVDMTQPSSDAELVGRDVLKLTDPAHEAQLRNIRAESTLNELMANDDIIRGYGQDEVIDAYNDIVQTAPAIADNRLALQTMLRQHLQQGAAAPFELQQLGEINSSLTKGQPVLSGAGRKELL